MNAQLLNKVEGLRGLGIVTNKHFFKSERSAEFVKNRLLVQEGIAFMWLETNGKKSVQTVLYFPLCDDTFNLSHCFVVAVSDSVDDVFVADLQQRL